MTSFSDLQKIGRAQYSSALPTSVPGYISGYAEDEISGVPVAPVYFYPLGTASTAIASGIAFSASGFGTITASAVTIGITGSLVSGGVATLDVPRCVAIFCTLSVTGSTFTIRGTDAYGKSQVSTFTGASGGAAYATTGMAISPVSFKTITSASYTSTTATGTSTTSVQIGTTDAYGLPYRITSQNRVQSITQNGWQLTATAVGTVLGAAGGFVQVGLSTAITPTATTTDVRGVISLPTRSIANDTNTYGIYIVGPSYNIAASADTKEITYGATPFTS